MKTLVIAVFALFTLTTTTRGQSRTLEQEVRGFIAEYDKGVAGRDINYLERVIADDYAYTGPNGKMTNREGALRHFKYQRDHPDNTRISLEHVNVRVHAVGNMALVTHDWTTQTAPIDATNVEPTTDRGRYTGVFEKRNGHWLVIAEHDSEQVYDDEWMVSGVLRAAREYNGLIERLKSGRTYRDLKESGDIATLSRLLADEYTYTGPEGVFLNKDQAIEGFKIQPVAIKDVAYLEQNVRTIGNGVAVETGMVKYLGTIAGVPSETIQRHTRTWAFYDGRWKITANHISPVTRQVAPNTR